MAQKTNKNTVSEVRNTLVTSDNIGTLNKPNIESAELQDKAYDALSVVGTITVDSDCLDMEKTLTCGQCFRFERRGAAYVGVVKNTVLVITKCDVGYTVDMYGNALSETEVKSYFDLDRDYTPILEALKGIDTHMKEAVAFGNGIRILNQDPFETLISFIISSNNNIPKIKMTIEALAEKFGEPIGRYDGVMYYTFPTLDVLSGVTEEALNVKAIGYRAKSVSLTCQAIAIGQLNLQTPYALDYTQAKVWLKQFYGVGDKVADCILLFAYGKAEAFPVDTWVKKMLGELYGVHKHYEAFVQSYFTVYPGIAQQYLFYYIRKFKES